MNPVRTDIYLHIFIHTLSPVPGVADANRVHFTVDANNAALYASFVCSLARHTNVAQTLTY